MADAGTSLDGGDEAEEGEHGTLPQTGVGLERLGIPRTAHADENISYHVCLSCCALVFAEAVQACLSESRDWSSVGMMDECECPWVWGRLVRSSEYRSTI
jgi:hypothetical protein